AKQDMKDALRAIAQLPCAELSDTQLGGKTFTPGVYCLSSADLAGTMTVNGDGDANARFIFRIAGTFSSATDSRIRLEGGAASTNVYVMADDNITVAANSDLDANLISQKVLTLGLHSDVSAKTMSMDGMIDIDTSSVGGGTGFIEICKNLAPQDPIPLGTIFTFNVSGLAQPILVPAGACSAPLDVAAGNVTVSEAARHNTAVTSIVTNPPGRRVSFSLALRQVVVAVPEGDVTDQKVVTFTNQSTRTGTIEICKRALDLDVTGMFLFTVQGAPGQVFAVPVGFCSGPITVVILQEPGTPFTANVTELAKANFRLEQVTTLPASRFISFTPNLGLDANGKPIANINGGFVTVALIVGGGPNQQTTVNFFNRSLPGVVKVCKITADPVRIPVGTLFRFSVMGTAPTSPTMTLP